MTTSRWAGDRVRGQRERDTVAEREEGQRSPGRGQTKPLSLISQLELKTHSLRQKRDSKNKRSPNRTNRTRQNTRRKNTISAKRESVWLLTGHGSLRVALQTTLQGLGVLSWAKATSALPRFCSRLDPPSVLRAGAQGARAHRMWRCSREGVVRLSPVQPPGL